MTPAIRLTFLIISISSPLIALIVGRKKRYSTLWFYVLVGLSFDLLLVFLKRVLHTHHLWAGNIFILIEFLFISFIYKQNLIKNNFIFYLLITILSMFFIVNTLQKSVYDLNTFGGSFFYLAFIFYSIFGFFLLLKEQKVPSLEKSSFFWINVAFIIYSSGNFLLFLFKDYLQQNENELFLLLWSSFFLILNILKNTFLGIALSTKTLDFDSN